MTKTEYARYIQSEDWQQRRKTVLAEAFHACERCDLPRWIARLVYDQDLHVHHLNYQNVGNERPEDLQVLCRRCHEIETFGRSDYKEIKTAVCSLCGSTHWDIYSNCCEKCKILFPKTGDEPFFFNFEHKNENKESFITNLIVDLPQAACCGYLPLREVIRIAEHLPALILTVSKEKQSFCKTLRAELDKLDGKG